MTISVAMLQCKIYNIAQMSALNQVGKQPKNEKAPPQRAMRSFEADDDVQRMLNRADRRRLKLVWVCNTALRKFLTEQGFARKKDLQ